MNVYWYKSPSGDGWMNLAADEYFLDHLGPEDLLIYLYINERAVIIGRNQNPWRECDTAAMERDGVQLVRRCTGGGAVYHDGGNLNFSFICGKDLYDVERQNRLVLDAVQSLGISAEATGRNDLLADGRKFSGHAFCSRGEIRQHHGTLLVNAELTVLQNYLTVSAEKLKAKGVSSVRSRVVNLSELHPGLTVPQMEKALYAAAERAFGPMKALAVTPEMEEGILPYLEKQRSWQWRMGASPAFDFRAEKRFSWGEAQLCLNVQGGIVSQAELYTDALDVNLPEAVREALVGKRFGRDALAAALLSLGGDAADLALLLAEGD